MVVGKDTSAFSVETGVNAIFSIYNVGKLGCTGIITGPINYQVASNIGIGSLFDYVFTTRIQSSYALDTGSINIGRIYKTFRINIDTGKFRRNEQLLICTFFFGSQTFPELIPSGNLYVNGSEEVGELTVTFKNHDTFEHILCDNINTICIVNGNFHRTEYETVFQTFGLRIRNNLCYIFIFIQHNNPLVFHICHIDPALFGYANPVWRIKGIFFSVVVECGNCL